MKLSFTEIIEKQTSLPYEKVIMAFPHSDILDLTSFPQENTNYENCEGKFSALIDPPSFSIDIIKSRVEGQVKSIEGLILVRLKVSPSRLLIGTCIVWSILMTLLLITKDYESLGQILQYIVISIIWISVPFVIARLKVHRDRKILEKWIKLTLPNKSYTSCL